MRDKIYYAVGYAIGAVGMSLMFFLAFAFGFAVACIPVAIVALGIWWLGTYVGWEYPYHFYFIAALVGRTIVNWFKARKVE